MRRGDICSVAARDSDTGQPRTAVILEDDYPSATSSVTICALTTDPTEADQFRLPVQPDGLNRLDHPSNVLVDELTTVPRTSVGEPVGRLADEDLVRLDRAIVVFLGIG